MKEWRLQGKVTFHRSYKEDPNSSSSNFKANAPENQGQMSGEDEGKAGLRS